MTNKQTLLRINIPRTSNPLRAADFRELLARETDLPEAFFHYENGKPKSGKSLENGGTKSNIEALPAVCILSGRSWVGILAQPGQEDLMDLAMGKAIRLVNNHAGTICKVELENPTFGCINQVMPATYWIREMVIKRRHKASREASIETIVEQRVKAGLERYAEAYGFDLPTWEDMDLRIVQCERPRGLAIRTTTGTTNEYATLVDVQFKAFVDLQGIWMLGNLTARGYGRVSRVREQSLARLAVIK